MLLVVAGVGLAAWPGKGGGSVLANVSKMHGLPYAAMGLKPGQQALAYVRERAV